MSNQPRFARHLALSTISFAMCFAMWGLVGAFGPVFREMFQLSGTQTAFLIVLPVLLGSLGRLPMGMLTDRFGGRIVFTGLMVFVSLSALIVPQISTYRGLVVAAFLMGMAGSSFAVGVGYVSGWAPPDKQGRVLGIYGLGTMGQSAAVFLGPVLASVLGWQSVFYIGSVMLLLWAVVFGLFARDAPRRKAPGSISAMIGLLRREKLAWGLGAFYFLTFGGFVAFSIYLPLLLRDQFKLDAWPTPVFELRDSWWWQLCSDPLEDGWRTESVARGYWQEYSRASFRSHC